MAELTISGAVGEPPAWNIQADVRTVQGLLQQVHPPLSNGVSVTGVVDAATIKAIREFQKRFMSNPDGLVEPNGRTLMHLNDGFTFKYVGCSPQQRMKIDRMLIDAQHWLDVVNRRLILPPAGDPDAWDKVRRIFHVRVESLTDIGRIFLLRVRFRQLREAFDRPFGIECVPEGFCGDQSKMCVILTDPNETIFFPPNAFTGDYDESIDTLIHERAHSVFQIEHAGSGAGHFVWAPDDDNGLTAEQAFANAYCYGWLAHALQPHYVRPEEEITTP